MTTPKGFKASGVECGLKRQGADLAVVVSERQSSVAAMFTSNRIKAAPIILSQKRVERGSAKVLVVNSGNANACTGEQGQRDAEEMAALVAQNLNIDERDVLVASTGIIGELLPMDLVRNGIAQACKTLSSTGGFDAAQAIMTTDTRPKHLSTVFDLSGIQCTIGGMAKGSGMINPNLATMISVLTTDVLITNELLNEALGEAVNGSFNSLTIDGEMSTNDCVFLFANGASGNLVIDKKDARYEQFSTALNAVCQALAKELARDGEGASKLVTVTVDSAKSTADAKKAAKAVANSLLVKTAIFGNDPNWGRVLSSVGATGVGLEVSKLTVKFAGIPVMEKGSPIRFDRKMMAEAMEEREVSISVSLGVGNFSAQVFTCDLTHDYITINAEYHT